MELSPIEFSVQSSDMASREALRHLLTALGPLKLDIEEAGTVELVLAEALNNIVEHAYPDPKPGDRIEIRCWQRKDGLHFDVRDHGKMMPDGRTPIAQEHDLDIDLQDMPEGGFGWLMIHNLAKEVCYQRVENTNKLTLRLAVGLPNPTV